jgi:hypothetical protein
VGRPLQLIHQSDGIVFEGNSAIALAVRNELVRTEAELAGALAGLEVSRWAEVRPVDGIRLSNAPCSCSAFSVALEL